jgi:hypothetical protein
VVARDYPSIMPSFILFSIISSDNQKYNFVFALGECDIFFGYFMDVTGTFTIPFLFLSALALLSLLRVFALPVKPGEPVTAG